MSVTIVATNQHHHNPSGFHNKIKWLLNKSKRSLFNLDRLQDYIRYDCNKFLERFSWGVAFIAAELIIKKFQMGCFDHQRENKFICGIDLNYIKHECIKNFGDSYKKEPKGTACLYIADITIHKLYNEFISSNPISRT